MFSQPFKLPPFKPEWIIEKPDYELGDYLLAWWIGYQADIQRISLYDLRHNGIAEGIISATKKIDTLDHLHMVLANCLNLAAKGDKASAGKAFRGHVLNDAGNINNSKLAELQKIYRTNQQNKSKEKRPIKNDAGITLDEEISELARVHPDEKPSELWLHLKTVIEEWCGQCEELIIDHKKPDSKRYQFPKKDGSDDTITYQSFRRKLAKLRNGN